MWERRCARARGCAAVSSVPELCTPRSQTGSGRITRAKSLNYYGRASIGYNFFERMRRSGWRCEDITDAPEVAAIVEDVMPFDEYGNRGRADTNWGRGDVRVARMTRADSRL